MFRWLGKNISTFLLAFVLATGVWIAAVNASNPDVEQDYPAPIPLEVVGQDTALVITNNYTKQITLNLRAPQSIWTQLTANDESIHAILDLSGLKPGEYSLTPQIQVGIQPTRIISFTPPSIEIKLEELVTQNFPINLSLDLETSIGYQAGSERLNVNEMQISGPKSLVGRVDKVQASFTKSDIREDINESLSIAALDAEGKVVRGIDLSFETVDLFIPISQEGGYRDMAVKVVVEGQVANLHRLTNITVFPLVVTVYSADTQLVNSLSGILETEALNIDGISEDVSARLKLNLPENVSLVGDQSVLVKVSVEAILSSLTISEKALEIINLDPALVAELSSLTVDVIISGPLPALDALSTDDLRVILDVEGLDIGVHQLVPIVEILDEDIQVETILPESIEITLSTAPLATPTASP
ncbi:MAG: hypothetical protein GY755_09870 [Chloroflexi bacterium]|nr:hypothetical protein [Chloroflexota bacterium]